MSAVKRPVLRYHGGKWKLAPWIIANMPPHRVYVEPFGGGASVLMRKDRVAAELYNDLDGVLVRIFRLLQDPEKADLLRRRLALTPFAREEFDATYLEPVGEIDLAAKVITRSFMGHGTDAVTRSCRTGFRSKMSDSRAFPSAAWREWPASVPEFVDRLRGVVIENRDASEVMLRTDTRGTLFYVDPPYLPETRSSIKGRSQNTHGYRHEMDPEQHRDLAVTLRRLRGMVMLSGYPSALYDELYGDWNCLEIGHLADGARKRTECLWFNDAAWERRPQPQLQLKGTAAGVHE